ncbi:MAG: hypothetical protein ABSH20_17615 [Tepidisphaeraceae bacterium]|jgi:hypothetical protein
MDTAQKTKLPLRLEWIEAGSLTDNEKNWRRHPPEQLQSLKDLMQDPEIGWAGACLFNERTKRLIDGHARKSIVDPKTPIPVLVGDWSEDAERKILATLDPVGAMAKGDRKAYDELLETITADTLWVRDLLHNTRAGMSELLEEDQEEDVPSAALPAMECQPFEHHDYIMLMFHDDQDFQQACDRLGIRRIQITYPGGKSKVGLGRVIDGAKAIKQLTSVMPAVNPTG